MIRKSQLRRVLPELLSVRVMSHSRFKLHGTWQHVYWAYHVIEYYNKKAIMLKSMWTSVEVEVSASAAIIPVLTEFNIHR